MTKLELWLIVGYRICNALIPWVCVGVLAWAAYVYITEPEEWDCITDMQCEMLEFQRYGGK
jgi:hypothetical protein